MIASDSAVTRRVLITTVPFGAVDRTPLNLLEQEGIDYVNNPLGRKLREQDLADMIGDFGVIIAGTEPITGKVLARAQRLKLIARVGVGLDNVDLLTARERKVLVSYTPDAPAPAVAELTLGLMLAALRFVPQADRALRGGDWRRYMGRRLAECTVGLVGVGRIGRRVVELLASFGSRVLANDMAPDEVFGRRHGSLTWVEKDQLYEEADVISIHVPLTPATLNLVTAREISRMKPRSVLVNTARGGIVNEAELAHALRNRQLAGAAVDVFMEEPYRGELAGLDNCILTCHMGSMSEDCRARMETEAVQETIRFLRNEPLQQLVPAEELAMRSLV